MNLKQLLDTPVDPDRSKYLGVGNWNNPDAALVAAVQGVDVSGNGRTIGGYLEYRRAQAKRVLFEGMAAERFGPGYDPRCVVYGLCVNNFTLDDPFRMALGPEIYSGLAFETVCQNEVPRGTKSGPGVVGA